MEKYTLAFNCPEKLERMEKTQVGFHCGSCQKQVVDLRHKSPEEIQQILNQSLTLPCAVFRRSQFRQPFLKMAALASFSLTLSIASYAQTKSDKQLGNEGPPPPNVRHDKVADLPNIPITGQLEPLLKEDLFAFPSMEEVELDAPVEEEWEEEVDELFGEIIETQPTPEGGIEAYLQALTEAVKIPNSAIHVEGRIYIQFVVEPTGETTRHTVARGIHEDLDQAVLEAFENLPISWTPGTQRGRKVPVKLIVPVTFRH